MNITTETTNRKQEKEIAQNFNHFKYFYMWKLDREDFPPQNG